MASECPHFRDVFSIGKLLHCWRNHGFFRRHTCRWHIQRHWRFSYGCLRIGTTGKYYKYRHVQETQVLANDGQCYCHRPSMQRLGASPLWITNGSYGQFLRFVGIWTQRLCCICVLDDNTWAYTDHIANNIVNRTVLCRRSKQTCTDSIETTYNCFSGLQFRLRRIMGILSFDWMVLIQYRKRRNCVFRRLGLYVDIICVLLVLSYCLLLADTFECNLNLLQSHNTYGELPFKENDARFICVYLK